MSYLGNIGDVVETGRGDGEISYEWRIPDFPSLAGEGGDWYASPDFDACGGRWCCQIYPKGLWRDYPSDSVGLLLWRLGGGPPKTLDATLGIRGAEGVEKKRGRVQEFSKDDSACFWSECCSRSKLREHKSRLMPGDVLIVSLDMKSAVPSIAAGIEKLSEDVGKLLVSGDDSDITVQVGEVEFKAHRLILSARCPVLAAMLKHETAEKVTNRITISDCEPEVFRDFLLYLYKGSAQHLSEENVFGLYRVADKYLADDLKQQCLQHIQDTLSVQTFCDAVQLALTHGQSGLLEQATDFATQNVRSIIRTVEWQNFNRDHPTEANEILIKALGPPS